MKTSSGNADMVIAPVTVHSNVVSHIPSASSAESFDGEHVTFFHALGSFGFDEGNLFVAMDFVTKDVMSRDVPHRFDRDDFPVELYFVALHDFLDRLADVVDPGINSSFLRGFTFSFIVEALSGRLPLTLSPVLVAALVAASRLS